MTGQQIATIQPTRKAVAGPTAPKNAVAQVIQEFQADTAEIDAQPEPWAARATLFLLAIGLVSAILWASFAHIDRLVTARGKIISTAPNIVVQSLESAIIRSIDVKVGDLVKAGAPLATLDPTFANADVEQIGARIASLDAAIARLEAEQAHGVYEARMNNNSEYAELQAAIWMERKTQFDAQMRLFSERIQRAQEAVASAEGERIHLQERRRIVREVESMRTELEQSKTGSRLNSLIAQDSRVEVERNLARMESAIVQGRHEMEALLAERDVYRRQWDGKIVEELVSKQNERDSLREQFVKAQRRKEMVRLETPVDAIVLEIAPRSVGSIIRDAEPFFTLVPMNAPLEVEAMVEGRQIGYIAVGDPVMIKIDAYSFQEHGMGEGVITVISSDAFIDNRKISADTPDGAFYKIRVKLTNNELRNVPDNFRLIPGMSLTAEVKVGQRSVIGYFLRPILRGVNESMREP